MDTRTVTLAELAVTHPGATQVFLAHDLDFCCGGRDSLAEACLDKGLDPEAILSAIAAEEGESGDLTGWAGRPLGDLMDFIQGHYHARLRSELPDLIHMAATVERVHAEKPSRPRGLADHLGAMHRSVLEHLEKEEQVLFPAIRAGRGAALAGPIHCMEEEHTDHGQALARMRELTADLSAPPEACATWRALYLRLRRLSEELMEHIHLENNILFPRALCE